MAGEFSIQTSDFYKRRGDDIYLKFEFVDENGNDIDITGWYSKFTLRDNFNDKPLTSLQKIHNDLTPGGGGIYYLGDSAPALPVGLDIEKQNQCIVLIPHEESAELLNDIYSFDIEFTTASQLAKQTFVRGNLILLQEDTPSV